MDTNPKEILSPNNIIISVFFSLSDNPLLFDLHTPKVQEVFVAVGPTQIFRKRALEPALKLTKVITKRQAMNGDVPGYDYEQLFNLTILKQRGSHYQLAPSKLLSLTQFERPNDFHELPFICLSSLGRIDELASHRIIKDDLIRLGRTIFRVLETHLTIDASENHPDALSDDSALDSEQPSGRICRICLAEGGSDLITPCACRGSCEWVHFSCLQTWIQSKVRREESLRACLYSLTRLQCQLCKQPLPSRINIAERTHLLVDFQWPTVPFILLEKMPSENERGRIFVMMTPGSHEVKIGRDPYMELRVNDYTLSRKHASIRWEDGSFWLKDEGSKFGSQILLRQGVQLGKLMCVQAGSKLYKLQPRPSIRKMMHF